MSVKKIAVLPGDGIGPEVIEEAIKVLDKVSGIFGIGFTYSYRGCRRSSS